MEDGIKLRVNLSEFSESINQATNELEQSVRENLIPVADLLEQKFTQVGEAIGKKLANAAKDGTLSMKKLGQSIALELSKVAVKKLITKPLEGIFKTVFGGARSNGGFVSNTQSYIVGEHGPEVFTPTGSGHITPETQRMSGGSTINLNISGIADVQGFQKSEAQIAANLARIMNKANRIS